MLRRLIYILAIAALLFALTSQPVLTTYAADSAAAKPTNTPKPTNAPRATNTPKPTLTATPTRASTATQAATVTLTPTATATSTATATAIPTSPCATSVPASGAYTVTLCFTAPLDGASVSADAQVNLTFSSTGTFPGVQRIVFYLNGAYLLTDYQTPYTFALPTTKWKDGTYLLQAEALLRDGTTTASRATIALGFNNGIANQPVNNGSFTPSSGQPAAPGSPFVVLAGGDGASGEANAVNVANLIGTLNPNLFLYLGDVYEKGSVAEFYNWYGANGTSLGAYYNFTNPTVGNHEYNGGAAPGYFDYWNNIPNYYSYNANGWHFISLNSNATNIGVTATSAQYQWLQQDLANNAQACTIAYYHHPLFNIGPEGATTAMADIWSLLAANGVSIVINGHDHDYQRWVPLDGSGNPSPNGITEFVAGGAGHGLQTILNSDSRVAYSSDLNPTAFGVLKLVLNSAGANFAYVNTAGAILDSGTVPCGKAGPDTQPPSAPSGLTATASSATRVDLAWQASTDNSGVAGYTIYRDGATLATVSNIVLSYSDAGAMPSSTYTYTVRALDAAGNPSALSNPASVTTPAMPAVVTIPVQADAYVNSAVPGSNYGSATVFRLLNSTSIYNGYLRFNVQGLAGYPITRARLQVYTTTNASQGISALAVADTSWGETSINTNNAPLMSSVIGTSGAFAANSWGTIDVTSYITGEGLYSLGLVTASTSTLSFAARESNLNAAVLVLDIAIPDHQAPTTPGALTATAVGPAQVNLSWTASNDNLAVTGYTIYRDGTTLSTVSGSTLAFSDTSAQPNTTYNYTVDAYDAAGNHSGLSDLAAATTPAMPASLTFAVQADTYVNSGSPGSNYGSLTVFRLVNSTSIQKGYLRFNVQGLAGYPVVRARLRVYTTTNSSAGISAYGVSNNTWGETTINYNNAPAMGSLIAASGAILANNWVTIDVTPSVTGEGTFSFGLATTSTSTLSFAARESNLNSAQLIIDLQ